MNSIRSFISYLFDVLPGPFGNMATPMITLTVILIISSVLFRLFYLKKRKKDFAFKRLFKKTGTRLLLFGIFFGLITIFRFEGIPYFSMRIWLYAGLLLFLYFIYFTAKTYKIDYPRESENIRLNSHKSKNEGNKYLPNKKKK